MFLDKVCDVPDLIFNHDPAVTWFIVPQNLVRGDQVLASHGVKVPSQTLNKCATGRSSKMVVLDQSKQTDIEWHISQGHESECVLRYSAFDILSELLRHCENESQFPEPNTLVRDSAQESEDRQQATVSVSDTKGGKYRTPRYAIF